MTAWLCYSNRVMSPLRCSREFGKKLKGVLEGDSLINPERHIVMETQDATGLYWEPELQHSVVLRKVVVHLDEQDSKLATIAPNDAVS